MSRNGGSVPASELYAFFPLLKHFFDLSYLYHCRQGLVWPYPCNLYSIVNLMIASSEKIILHHHFPLVIKIWPTISLLLYVLSPATFCPSLSTYYASQLLHCIILDLLVFMVQLLHATNVYLPTYIERPYSIYISLFSV